MCVCAALGAVVHGVGYVVFTWRGVHQRVQAAAAALNIKHL